MTSELKQAISAIKAGDKATGKQLLRQVLGADHRNENAWLWMTKVVDSPQEQMQCLQNVLKINPNNDLARRGLAQLQASNSSPKAPSPAQPPAAKKAKETSLPAPADSPPDLPPPRPKPLRSLSKPSNQIEDKPATRECPYCAETIKAQAQVCRFCGRDLATGLVAGQSQPIPATPQQVIVQMPPQREWSPGVAAVLSFLFPGAGQIYKGQVGRGLLAFLMTVIGYAFFIIPGIVMHLITIIDATQGNPYGNSGQTGSGSSSGSSSGTVAIIIVLVVIIFGLCVICPMLGGIMGGGV